MTHFRIDRDPHHVWSKEAEECLIQCVKDTDRDENWITVAATLNAGKFSYKVQDEYDTHGIYELKVQPEHCRLYYDRQIQYKYPNDYVRPRGYDVPVPCCLIT